MIDKTNAIPTFQGMVKICAFEKNGEFIVKNFETTKYEDRLLKEMANEMAPNGCLYTPLNKENANKFHKLLESILGLKIKKGHQQRVMSNVGKSYINYGSKTPEKNGVCVTISLKA